MPSPSEYTQPIRMFISYSHKDERLKKELLDHLSPWIRHGIIESWDNRQTRAGEEPNQEILRHINEADIVLCLLSSDFLSSQYDSTIEMQRAWERRAIGEVEVIPVLLRAVEWRATRFRTLQVIPRDQKSIKYRFNRDRVFAEVAREIEMVIDVLRGKKA